jgi:Ser/Thr protein kinase RdoA (MazF antagonist)
MWRVDRLIDAAGRNPIAEQILERWRHDQGTARFFRSSSNFLYTFDVDGTRHFLRFAEQTERRRAAIEAEVALLTWLAGAGAEVAVPLGSRAGNLVESVATPWGTFHAVAFADLGGAALDVADLTLAQFEQWGMALGELHGLLRTYPGACAAARETWKDHLALARSVVPLSEQAIYREIDLIAAALAALPVSRETFGLIHFDFELDNLRWRDGAIGIIDFDDCAHYWYMADVAFALGDVVEGPSDLGTPPVEAFLRGYGAACPLDDGLRAQLPLLLRVANLLDYVQLARSCDLAPADNYPDWLTQLDGRFRDWMAEYRASLVHQYVTANPSVNCAATNALISSEPRRRSQTGP